MKKITLLAFSLIIISNATLQAQNWINGGNTLTGVGRFGTNSNNSVIFETFNTEHGRLTSAGLWGFGTSTPNAKVTVNSPTGLSPFRVQLNGSTKFLVNGAGGVAIGASVSAPVDGLYVKGQVGIGIVTPDASYKLQVVNSNFTGTGIYAKGSSNGLIAESEGGYGVLARGYTGIRGEGENTGVFGISTSDDGAGIDGVNENGGVGGSFISDRGYGLYATTLDGPYAGYFNGDIFSSGAYYGSDKNIKKNIREVSNAMSILKQLEPKNYEFKNEGNYASLHLPKGNHYGLLAQDVEKVLPNLVKESSHQIKNNPVKFDKGKPTSDSPKESINIKAVNYTELIPLLIKGIQEQEAKIDKQQQIITMLTDKIAKLEAINNTAGYTYDTDLTGISLGQNHPNPVEQNTTFRYTIPTGANAQILVYDAISGQLVKTLPAPGTGQIQLNGSGMKAGNYVYSLMVNGKVAASKQMVISK